MRRTGASEASSSSRGAASGGGGALIVGAATTQIGLGVLRRAWWDARRMSRKAVTITTIGRRRIVGSLGFG